MTAATLDPGRKKGKKSDYILIVSGSVASGVREKKISNCDSPLLLMCSPSHHILLSLQQTLLSST